MADTLIIAVRTVQQGLTQARRSDPSIPNPGPIDGQWGPSTRHSLAYFIWGNAMPDRSNRVDGPIYEAMLSLPVRSPIVIVPTGTMIELSELAGQHMRAFPTSSAPASLTQANTAASTVPVLTIGPHLDEQVLASPGGESGLSMGAKIALGVLAAGAVGGIIWMATKRKR
jgi:hypothetical protein